MADSSLPLATPANWKERIWRLTVNTIVSLLIVYPVTFLSSKSASGEPAMERATLRLSGQNCTSHRQAITARLEQTPGVIYFDMISVPDHVLIDHFRDRISAEDLSVIVNETIGIGESCRGEVMRSCITANVGAHQASAAHRTSVN
jgi:hypothetical protein